MPISDSPIRAGQDIAVQGSDVASTNGTSLLAGRNVLIDGATESFETSHAESKKKSGLMSSGGIGVTLGSSSLKTTQDDHTEQTRGSTIGSVLGNVDIQAGKDLTIRGSDLVAGKDINLIGQNVSILEAQNRNRSEETREQKKSGLTLALSGSVGSAVSAYESSKQARHEDDSRLAALKGIQAGLTGYQAWQAAEQGGMTSANADQFVGIAISLGSQQSKSKTVQEQSIGQGSTLTAGNNLNILATGAGKVGEDGDIRIQGSQLKAGQDVMLAANRDLILEAASNTQKLDGKNSSSGGNVGVSLGFGGSGGGLSVFANGNKGTGFEHGNGTTWTETTVDAGRQVTLVSGRDTSLIGAQVSGEQITAKVGRDLTLRSLQDTDEYKSEQKNVSAGVSVAIIGSGGSASLSVDKSKIHSNYDSVQEQTGLYAGKGGYDIEVGKHTQLDGAVISSTTNADQNRLSTDTLGWRDIRNEADYKTQQQGVSVSSGGGDGPMFIGNAPNGMVTAYTHGDSDCGTTHSAISAGTIDIRNGEAQQQDIASLSRDVEHANGSISPIFDKEKEQRRLQEVQLIAQIGSQSMDIIRTNGEIKATKAGQEELDEKGTPRPDANATAQEIQDYNDALANTKAYQDVMREYGTGSNYQKAAQAVTAALQYLAGGDIGGAVAGASAPYVATLIKQQTGDNDTARIMAQAVLGAIVANAQGNSGVAGAAGAATGELIAASLYPNKKPEDLTENERQIVSALSTLAAGMAGGLATGDSAGVVAAAGAGKTAVENNFLSGNQVKAFDQEMQECTKAGDCGKVIDKYVALNEENRQMLRETCAAKPWVCADHMKDLVNTGLSEASPYWQPFSDGIKNENIRMMVEYENGLDLKYINDNTSTLTKTLVFASQPENWLFAFGGIANLTSASTKSMATGAGLGMAANGGVQLATGNTGDKFDWVGFMTAGVTGGMSAGQALIPTVQTNVGGAYIASQLNGQSSVDAMLGAAAGSALGFGLGSVITGKLEEKIVSRYFGLGGNSANALKYSESALFPGSYLLKETGMSPAPGIAGSVFGGIGSEYSNYLIIENLKRKE